MALVVICGQPCSGKSMAAACLASSFKASEAKPMVRIIDESSLHLGRNESYADMNAEKNLRGVLRSEVDRSVSKDNIIIVDSLNNIKGYRYELWCLARAAGIRYCVLFCDVEENICRQWNNERRERGESTYDERIFADLARRFERPDRRNRWDSPLFELKPSKDRIEEQSLAIVEAVSYLTRKVDSKSRDVKVLQPTIATQNARTTEVNSLYEMDQATQEVINVIVETQAQGLMASRISFGQHLPTISFFFPFYLNSSCHPFLMCLGTMPSISKKMMLLVCWLIMHVLDQHSHQYPTNSGSTGAPQFEAHIHEANGAGELEWATPTF